MKAIKIKHIDLSQSENSMDLEENDADGQSLNMELAKKMLCCPFDQIYNKC